MAPADGEFSPVGIDFDRLSPSATVLNTSACPLLPSAVQSLLHQLFHKYGGSIQVSLVPVSPVLQGRVAWGIKPHKCLYSISPFRLRFSTLFDSVVILRIL